MERQRQERRLKAQEERDVRRQGYAEQRAEMKAHMTRKAVKTQIITVGHDSKKTGTLGRAAAGALVGGAVGAVVGAATAGSKQTGDNITFLVYYSDNSKEIVTVSKTSLRYNEFMRLLDSEHPMA